MFIYKTMEIIRNIERFLVVSIFLVMVLLFTFSVLIRELPGNMASTFAWIEEAVRLLNLFLVFLALGISLEKGRHVSISTLRERLNPVVGLWLRRVTDVIGILFSGYFIVLSFQLLDFVLQTGQISPTLEIPMAWIYGAPTVGFSLLALRYFLSLFNLIDRYANEESEEEKSVVPGESSNRKEGMQ